MEKVVVIEILDRVGRIKERHRIDRFPVRIGRAYDNDIIMDDRYVSPHHIQLSLNEALDVVATDLDSENGTYHGSDKIHQLVLPQDRILSIGHSMVRFREADYCIEPTRIEAFGTTALLRTLEKPWLFVTTLLVLIGLELSDKYFGSYHNVHDGEFFLFAVYMVIGVAMWAGAWAIVSRITRHQFYMNAHLSSFILAMIVLGLFFSASEWYGYVFLASNQVEWLNYCALVVVLSALLFSHLRYCSLASNRRLSVIAVALAGSLVGVGILMQWAQNNQFSTQPQFKVYFKASSLRLARHLKPEEFFSSLVSMKEVVDKAALQTLPRSDSSDAVDD